MSTGEMKISRESVKVEKNSDGSTTSEARVQSDKGSGSGKGGSAQEALDNAKNNRSTK